MPILIYIVGPPGAGKTTACKSIAAAHNIHHISTGELLRSSNTCMDTIQGGNLVNTNIIVPLLQNEMQKHMDKRAILIDGYPRNMENFAEFDKVTNGMQYYVIYMSCPKDVAADRLSIRGRHDDAAETVAHRLSIYQKETIPVITAMQARGKLHWIDACHMRDIVAENMEELISSLLSATAC